MNEYQVNRGRKRIQSTVENVVAVIFFLRKGPRTAPELMDLTELGDMPLRRTLDALMAEGLVERSESKVPSRDPFANGRRSHVYRWVEMELSA